MNTFLRENKRIELENCPGATSARSVYTQIVTFLVGSDQ